jgi:hypothetical protein
MTNRIHSEHEEATGYALQARHWFHYGHCAKSDGYIISASFAAMSWQRKWSIADRHSDHAEYLELQSEPVFPGVKP